MESKWNRAKMKLAEGLEIPSDVILSTPKITISSNNEISIENHKGIIAFEREYIKINSKIGTITINGKDFEIAFIGGQTIVIQGEFKSVIYEGMG